MADREHTLRVYQDLADSFDQQHNASLRDLFLLLAADAALRAGHQAEAELLRQRLLRLNPHHLLKPYASFAEASSYPDIQGYVEELRQKYPAEVAEEMLESVVPHAPAPGPADIPPTMPPTPRQHPLGGPPAEDAGEDVAFRLRPEDEPKVYRLHPEVEPGRAGPAPRPREPERPARKAPPPARPSGPPPLDETLPPRPAHRPAAERPAPRPAPSQAAPPTRPPAPRPRPAAPRRAPAPEPPRHAPPGPAPHEPEDDKRTAGSWVGVGLCVLVLLVGLAAALLALVPLPDSLFGR